MQTFTIITSGGRKTKVTGILAEVVDSQKGRKTGVGIYLGTFLICTVYGGVVTLAY